MASQGPTDSSRVLNALEPSEPSISDFRNQTEVGDPGPPEARPGISPQAQSNSTVPANSTVPENHHIMGDTSLAREKSGLAPKSTSNTRGKRRTSGLQVAHKQAIRPQDSSKSKANATPSSLPKVRRMKAASSTSTDVPSPGRPCWHVVNPPTYKHKRKKDDDVDLPQEILPRIWASGRSELFAVLPELAKSINGISWLYSDTPILILEGNDYNWPSDTWDTATTFSLTMKREFFCLAHDFDVPVQSLQSQQLSTDATPMDPATSSDQNHCHIPAQGSQLQYSHFSKSVAGTVNPVQSPPFGVFPRESSIAGQEPLVLTPDISLPHLLLEQYYTEWHQYSTHIGPYFPLGGSQVPFAQNCDAQSSTTLSKSTRLNSSLSSKQSNDKPAGIPRHSVCTTKALGFGNPRDEDEEFVLMYPEPSQVSPRPITSTLRHDARSYLDCLENCQNNNHLLSVPPKTPDPISQQSYPVTNCQYSPADGHLQGSSFTPTHSFGSDWSCVSRISDGLSRGICYSGRPRACSQPNSLLQWRPSDWDFYTSLTLPHSDASLLTCDMLTQQDSTKRYETCYRGGMYTPSSGHSVISESSSASSTIDVFTMEGYYPFATWDPASYSGELFTGYPVSSVRSTMTAIAGQNPVPEGCSHPKSPAGAKALTSIKRFNPDTQDHSKFSQWPKIHDVVQVPPVRTGPVVDKIIDQRIPKNLPPEIQALVDSYERGVPVVVIMSRSCTLLPRHIPARYAYSFLGFFRLTELTSERIVPGIEQEVPKNCVGGWVRWLLKFTWASGGEDFLPDSISSSRPWWSPLSTEDLGPMNSNPTKWRDLREHCYSLLPLHLLQSFGMPDGEFPRGWYCVDCGKLNEQILLRHRRCSYCQPSSSTALGYALCLDTVREPQGTMSTSLPTNIFPDGIESMAILWGDDMRTFSYSTQGYVFAKHIFTCNQAALQEEPTILFRDFQLHVELSRQRDKGPAPGPYFVYLAGLGHYPESKAVAWEDVPFCVTQAREFILHRSRVYGEHRSININKLTVLAWVTTGSKKGVIEAKNSYVPILCLGADVLLSLAPMAGFPISDNGGAASGSDCNVKTDNSNSKKQNDTFLITLVHGDILILRGDDFECSIKRTGTSILLFGSSVSETRKGCN